MRQARPDETPSILHLLQRHEASSIFPIANLLGRGLATDSWVFTRADRITGYLGLTENGTLLPQAPEADWTQARAQLAGKAVLAFAGPPEQCEALAAALGVQHQPKRMHSVERGYSLTLDALQMPDCDGLHIAPIQDKDLALVTQWRKGALVETMGFAAQDAPREAERQVLAWQKANLHRILWRDQTPLALAGVNAEIPQVLQLGGVYTPPALRAQGYARRTVALLLRQARSRGIARACLFTASDAAARAYAALGFSRSHDFMLSAFTNPQRIACP